VAEDDLSGQRKIQRRSRHGRAADQQAERAAEQAHDLDRAAPALELSTMD